jgi:hypothetical protein
LGQQIEKTRAEQAAREPLTAVQRRSLATQASRHDRNEERIRLHGAGALVSGMAQALNLDPKTVRCKVPRRNRSVPEPFCLGVSSGEK